MLTKILRWKHRTYYTVYCCSLQSIMSASYEKSPERKLSGIWDQWGHFAQVNIADIFMFSSKLPSKQKCLAAAFNFDSLQWGFSRCIFASWSRHENFNKNTVLPDRMAWAAAIHGCATPEESSCISLLLGVGTNHSNCTSAHQPWSKKVRKEFILIKICSSPV